MICFSLSEIKARGTTQEVWLMTLHVTNVKVRCKNNTSDQVESKKICQVFARDIYCGFNTYEGEGDKAVSFSAD